MAPAAMEALIRDIGRTPKQRTTLYDDVAADRVAASFDAADLAPVVLPRATRYERKDGTPVSLNRPGIGAAE
jgi:FO synthase